MKLKSSKRSTINHTGLEDIAPAARLARPASRPHFAPLRSLVSPFAFAALASALLLAQGARAADAPGGGPLNPLGGIGGAGNGHSGGDGGGIPYNGSAGSGGNGGAGAAGAAGGTVGQSTNAPSVTITTNTNGGNGGNSLPGAGAGGGGSGLYAGSTSITVNAGVAVTGGNGGVAADNGVAGGGGGGGTGVAATANGAAITNLGTITGGSGGAGGGGVAGGGGGGGDGLLATGGAVTLTNSGVITGGNGGSGGGSPFGYPGASGAGGAGVDLMAGGNTINNSGSITGGNSTPSSINNAGGAGIITFGNDVINNSGSISGGLAGTGARADAIQFNGTGNRLNILSGAASTTGALELTTGAGAAIQAQAAGVTISSAIILGSGSALTFDTSSAQGFTVSGAISGTGTLRVGGGAATIILTGSNSYSGTTTIDASGRLQIGNGGTSGTLGSGAVVNDGALSFNRSDTLVVGSAISGGGTLTQAGSGTTVLTGTNSYSGATTISGGTLQVGNGGTAGTLGTAGVFNNGVLAFNRSDTLTVGNAITGTGALTQAGTGTTILTAANAYGGATSVTSGTLQVGNGGTTGTISDSASIGAGATLAFRRSDIVTYNGVLTGGGTLRQTGSGTLLLTGNSGGFAGLTSVDAGALRVNGVLSGTLVVGTGATVEGAGTVGTTTVNSGGTLSAGTAGTIGTLNINGNLTFNSGSTYLVDVAGAGGNDRLAATGAANLTGGTVRVNALDAKANYRTGQTYTLLSAAGGLGGTTFAGATSSSNFLSLALGYTGTTATLTVTVTGSFAEVAQTRNQYATGSALDTLAATGGSLALYNKLLALSSADARRAFDMLDGEIHASLKTGLLSDSSFVRDGLVNRLRTVGEDDNPGPVAAARAEQGLWFAGYGAWNKYSGDSPNAGQLKGNTGGMLLGYDRLFAGGWRAGVAAGYGYSGYKADERASSGKADSYTVGAYAGTKLGNVALRLGAAQTWHSVDTTRNSSFPGFAETNTAAYRARTTQVFGEAAYALHRRGTTLEPYANLAHVNLHDDGYSESGTAGLQGQGGNDHVTYGTLGARLSTPVRLGTKAGSLRAGLGWRHAEGDVQPAVTQAFQNSASFTVSGVPIARDAAIVEAGLDLPLARNANFSVSYGGQIAAHAWQHSLGANLRLWF
jgi:outer membrane autotransporter protein